MPVLSQLPGRLAQPIEQEALRRHVSALCQLQRYEKFPGSQPVSFMKTDLVKLESEDYWVCEKSDGIRVLVLIAPSPKDPSRQDTFLIDRHNDYRELSGFRFPHHRNPKANLGNTILDGELVIDVDPRTQRETVRLLAFDCLVVDDDNVMEKPLTSRYGRLRDYFYQPYSRMLRESPGMVHSQSFEVALKPMRPAYHVKDVFDIDIPQLQHGYDGLIYTCAVSAYVLAATDNRIMKWKPPSENSIDFKLVLRFPPQRNRSNEPDFYAKPIFGLHVWTGGSNYEPYDVMHVSDEEWEQMKRGGEQYDDRIVEVCWDGTNEHWRMMRFRDDKPNGNFLNIVEKIIQSIRDGVEKDDLLSRSNAIRTAWKLREEQQNQMASQTRISAVPPSALTNSNQRSPFILSQEMRFGPLAAPLYSRVGGPAIIAGVHR